MAASSSTSRDVKKIVVLMLENRSFDHVMLSEQQDDLLNYPKDHQRPLTIRPQIEGEEPIGWDPPHEYPAVYKSLYEGYYEAAYEHFSKTDPTSAEVFAQKVIEILPRNYLSIYAKDNPHLSCSNWFSDVPSGTWPNRSFVHFGTSGGNLDTPDWEKWGSVVAAGNYFSSFVGQRSIFSDLSKAGKSWKIYYHAPIPPISAVMMPNLFAYSKIFDVFSDQMSQEMFDLLGFNPNTSGFRPFSEFILDCETNKLADYSFIEPDYGVAQKDLKNDQHPPAIFELGENLIRQVKTSLENSTCEDPGLLLVVYDEHGGLYDSVKPPKATPPDQAMYETRTFNLNPSESVFTFDRYGVRVPAVLFPFRNPTGEFFPKSETGFPFSHSSIPATIRALFLPGTHFLSDRERDAPIFYRPETTFAQIELDFPIYQMGGVILPPTGIIAKGFTLLQKFYDKWKDSAKLINNRALLSLSKSADQNTSDSSKETMTIETFRDIEKEILRTFFPDKKFD